MMVAALKSLKGDLMAFIDKMNCGPIVIRIAWHDAGTYDQRISSWPERGGANGSIVHTPEMSFGANAGLDKARRYLVTYKEKYPMISWPDVLQMASACAVEHMGGPVIPMKYGRVFASDPSMCPGSASREGFGGNAGLPDAKPPFGCGATDPAQHLRNVFGKKMGFTDQEIVALSGAHTIGRAFKDRSGTCPFASGQPTNYTGKGYCPRHDGAAGLGMEGGQSWCKNWLKFDNEYFHVYKEKDEHLVWFPTDACLTTDPVFSKTFELYANDAAAFARDYALAHKKLSELGSKWEPEEGITL